MNSQVTKKQLDNGFPFVCYADRFALCGQVQEEELKEFKKESWTHILNLRNQKELDQLDFKASELCQKLDLNYNHIPIIINGELNKEALKKIHTLLSKDEECRFVIHCASGTRSMMVLIAHFVFSKNYKQDELFFVAKELGCQPLMLERIFQVVKGL